MIGNVQMFTPNLDYASGEGRTADYADNADGEGFFRAERAKISAIRAIRGYSLALNGLQGIAGGLMNR